MLDFKILNGESFSAEDNICKPLHLAVTEFINSALLMENNFIYDPVIGHNSEYIGKNVIVFTDFKKDEIYFSYKNEYCDSTSIISDTPEYGIDCYKCKLSTFLNDVKNSGDTLQNHIVNVNIKYFDEKYEEVDKSISTSDGEYEEVDERTSKKS